MSIISCWYTANDVRYEYHPYQSIIYRGHLDACFANINHGYSASKQMFISVLKVTEQTEGC